MFDSIGFPVMTNGFSNVPVSTILTWEFQGCRFAFFNEVGIDSSYNICAKDFVSTSSIISCLIIGQN